MRPRPALLASSLACLAAVSSVVAADSSGFASTQTTESSVILSNKAFCVNPAANLHLTKERPFLFFTRKAAHPGVHTKASAVPCTALIAAL